MGVVWHAVHSVTRKPVALKFLKPSATHDPRAVQRFLREARAACAVRHPSVVEVHDVLELEDGSPVMVMDPLTGETFAERLAREGAMPLAEVAHIMVHVCSAVGCAHALGIVHRDLKPENIFLARAHDGSLDVKVLDFGIAKLTASEGDAAHTGATTGTGAILGTPYYMAPEQLFGEKDVDHRADIWALGIILYEALVGSRPTQGANMGQIFKLVTTGGFASIGYRAPKLPGPMVNLVSRMLSRERTLRPADVREVLATLSGYTDESFVPVEAAPIRAVATAAPVSPVSPDAPVAPVAGESLSDPSAADANSDTVRASTVEALAMGRRPASSSARATKAKSRLWGAAAAAGAVGLLGVAGMAWRGSPATVPTASSTPVAASFAPPTTVAPPASTPFVVPSPHEASPPSLPAAATSSPNPSPSVAAPTSRPPMRREASLPGPGKGKGAASASPALPPRPVDPGSYQ